MPKTICPHCKETFPEKFLQDAEKNRQIDCPLCKRPILIDKSGTIIMFSGSFFDGCTIEESAYEGVH